MFRVKVKSLVADRQSAGALMRLLRPAFERFPDLEVEMEGSDDAVVTTMTVIANTEAEAKQKAGYYMTRAAARTRRAVRYHGKGVEMEAERV